MSNQPYPYGPDPRMSDYQEPTEPMPYQEPAQPYEQSARNVQNGNAYEQRQYQNYVDPAGNRVEQREETVEDKNMSRANARYWITTVIYFLLGVLEVILALRFIFRLLGANQYNGFIQFLYGLSSAFVGPFNGIFNDQTIGSASVFEVSTLIAMLVYALIAWGLVSLGRVLFAANYSGRQNYRTTRRQNYS
jgi:hypothetical protein